MTISNLVLLCLEAYLVLAIPAFVLIWAGLVVAKNADQQRNSDDLENNSPAKFSRWIHSMELEQ